MAEETFAVSRISPAPATERDYDSICAALMHSERGRWFLQEYARRNRSADTQVLLAAIQRIEAVVCAERNRQVQPGLRSDLLEMAKAITRTRAEVAEIGAVAGRPPADQANGEASPSARQPRAGDVFAAAARIRDVTWAMRGHGFDPSTCDQLEELAAAILSASALRDPTDHRASKLSEVLQYLEHRIETLLGSNQDGDARASEPYHDAFEPAPGAKPQPVGERAVAFVAMEPDAAKPEASGDAPVSPLNNCHDVAVTAHDDLEGDAAAPLPSSASGAELGSGAVETAPAEVSPAPPPDPDPSRSIAKASAAQAASKPLREAATSTFLPEIDMGSIAPNLRAAPPSPPERPAIGLASDAGPAPPQSERDGAANFSPLPCGKGLGMGVVRCGTSEQNGTTSLPTPPQEDSESSSGPSQLRSLTELVPEHISIGSPESLAAPPLEFAAPTQPAAAVPQSPAGDPLAALKAMSDDELIALFS